MTEIDRILKKIEERGCGHFVLSSLDYKEKARRIMAVCPETSFWKMKDFEELISRMEEQFKKAVVSDVL